MKALAPILLVVSLAVAVLGASTAYHVSLSLPDDQLLNLTLSDDAGRREMPSGESEPLLPAGRKLTPLDVQLLRDNDLTLVRVNEFSLRRWPGGLAFLISSVVMAVCAVWIGRNNRRRTAQRVGEGAMAPPADLLRSAQQAVERLIDKIEAEDDATGRQRLMLTGLDAIGQEQVAVFLESKEQLVGELGLAAAVEVMGRFAAAERQTNRAWSAAADGHDAEAIASLHAARQLMAETADVLAQS